MSLGGFILTHVITIVCQLLQRDLERKHRLDLPTFIHGFFYPYFFTQLFTTFTLSLRRGSDDLPLDQHDKDKGYSWEF